MSVLWTEQVIKEIHHREDLPTHVRKLMINLTIQYRESLEMALGGIELIHLRATQQGESDDG